MGSEPTLQPTDNCIKVLDKGFVRLVKYMASDSDIVQSARVSYGPGTKKKSEDRALIRYLMRHRHETPFEMCLHGDTLIPTLPCRNATQKLYTIREICQAFQKGGKDNSWVKLLKIRSVNENGEIVPCKIIDGKYMGKKKCFKITENSMKRSIILTEDHPILREIVGNEYVFNNLLENGLGSKILMNGKVKILCDEEKIIKLWQQGVKIDLISKEMGISKKVIYSRLKKNNISTKRRKGVRKYNKKEIDIVMLKDMWENNNTIEEIADYFSTSRSTIFRILKESSIDSSARHGFYKKDFVLDPRARARRLKTSSGNLCEVCGDKAQETHHLDENPHNNDISNLVMLCRECHKSFHNPHVQIKTYSSSICSIEDVGEQDVFDIQVDHPSHCFVANGFIVHNCSFKFHVKAPIWIFRQWHRHRIGISISEMSARYSEMPEEFYVPELDRIQKQSKNNKQGSAECLDDHSAAAVQRILNDTAEKSFSTYYQLLNVYGVARELARNNLPVSTYSEMYWACNLRSLFHFLGLRLHPHAQWEIREYAKVLYQLIKPIVPVACEAFEDYVLNARTFSSTELKTIKNFIEKIKELSPEIYSLYMKQLQDDLGIKDTAKTKRELDEFKGKLGLE